MAMPGDAQRDGSANDMPVVDEFGAMTVAESPAEWGERMAGIEKAAARLEHEAVKLGLRPGEETETLAEFLARVPVTAGPLVDSAARRAAEVDARAAMRGATVALLAAGLRGHKPTVRVLRGQDAADGGFLIDEAEVVDCSCDGQWSWVSWEAWAWHVAEAQVPQL